MIQTSSAIAARRPETADLAVLDGLEELALDPFGQEAHLVEEERPVLRRLEQPGLRLARIRERPRS
jgi:hypothetical protein